MNKLCIIRQPAGIGDIFFCQKIARQIIDKLGYKVLWPILPHLLFIKDYIKYTNLEFCNYESAFSYKKEFNDTNIRNIIAVSTDDILVPLHGHTTCDDSIMISKYKFINLDWKDWSNYFTFERNYNKEKALFYDVLQLTDNSKYNFVNTYFATPPHEQKVNITTSNNLQNVNLVITADFNVFDWCKVLENATNIYTAETCFNFILEKLKLKAETMTMYSKWKPPDFHHIDKLFTKKWVYVK